MRRISLTLAAAGGLLLLQGCATQPDLTSDLEQCGLALLAAGTTDYKVLLTTATATPACMRLPAEVLSAILTKTQKTQAARGIR